MCVVRRLATDDVIVLVLLLGLFTLGLTVLLFAPVTILELAHRLP